GLALAHRSARGMLSDVTTSVAKRAVPPERVNAASVRKWIESAAASTARSAGPSPSARKQVQSICVSMQSERTTSKGAASEAASTAGARSDRASSAAGAGGVARHAGKESMSPDKSTGAYTVSFARVAGV